MKPNRIVFGVLLSFASVAAGGVIGLVLGGFGICAMDLTPGVLGCSALIGAAFSATIAVLWRKAWWAGALSFSFPALLGVSFGVVTKEWPRVLGIFVCIGASFAAALVVRYPGPRSLRP
jgi:hypothetical protein